MDVPAGPHLDEFRGKAETFWSFHETGDHLQVKAVFLRPPRTPRKKVGQMNKGFTHSARLRMLKMVAKVNWKSITQGLFITLTYPDGSNCFSKQERNKHRYVFFRSMEKYLGKKVGALWRIEWMARKSGEDKGKLYPHFHLIVTNVPFIPWQEIRAWWKQAIGHEGHVATDVKRLNGKKHHAVYIAKYAAKVTPASSLDSVPNLNNQGRHWGQHRASEIPKHAEKIIDGLTNEQVEKLKAFARKHFPWYGEFAELGFSIFGTRAVKMREILLEIVLGDFSPEE